MSKFIGEMSFEEFKDGLKIIISREGDIKLDDEKEKPKNFKESIVKFGEDIRYFFSINMLKDLKNDIVYFFKNFVGNEVEDEPLTKELFIKKGKKFKASLWDLIETIVFVVVMVIIIRFFLCEIRWIPSGSMRPTLLEGDRIVVERVTKLSKTPERGDIMVFYPPFEELQFTPWKVFSRLTGFFCKDTAYIKRVVGLPGEKYEIKPDELGKFIVFIDDKPLNEPYIKSPYDYPPCTEAMYCGPAIIPPNHYLMLGDNRGNSQDGRYWGLLSEDRFIGRAVYLFWPLNRIKKLDKNF